MNSCYFQYKQITCSGQFDAVELCRKARVTSRSTPTEGTIMMKLRDFFFSVLCMSIVLFSHQIFAAEVEQSKISDGTKKPLQNSRRFSLFKLLRDDVTCIDAFDDCTTGGTPCCPTTFCNKFNYCEYRCRTDGEICSHGTILCCNGLTCRFGRGTETRCRRNCSKTTCRGKDRCCRGFECGARKRCRRVCSRKRCGSGILPCCSGTCNSSGRCSQIVKLKGLRHRQDQ